MNMKMTRSTKALNALLDVWSNLCYTDGNVEQDHSFDGDGHHAFHGTGGRCRAIVHSPYHARSEGLSVRLLR